MPPVEVDALEHGISFCRMMLRIERLIYLREKSGIGIFGPHFQSLPQIFQVVVLANLYLRAFGKYFFIANGNAATSSHIAIVSGYLHVFKRRKNLRNEFSSSANIRMPTGMSCVR